MDTVKSGYCEDEIMIRPCLKDDFKQIFLIINEAAQVYKGVIPGDCFKEPYMSEDELSHEIDEGVWSSGDMRKMAYLLV